MADDHIDNKIHQLNGSKQFYNNDNKIHSNNTDTNNYAIITTKKTSSPLHGTTMLSSSPYVHGTNVNSPPAASLLNGSSPPLSNVLPGSSHNARPLSRRASSSSLTTQDLAVSTQMPETPGYMILAHSPLEHTTSTPSLSLNSHDGSTTYGRSTHVFSGNSPNGNTSGDTFVSQQEKLLQRLQSLKESKRALLAKRHTLSSSSSSSLTTLDLKQPTSPNPADLLKQSNDTTPSSKPTMAGVQNAVASPSGQGSPEVSKKRLAVEASESPKPVLHPDILVNHKGGNSKTGELRFGGIKVGSMEGSTEVSSKQPVTEVSDSPALHSEVAANRGNSQAYQRRFGENKPVNVSNQSFGVNRASPHVPPQVDGTKDTVGTRPTAETLCTPVIQAQESPGIATKHSFVSSDALHTVSQALEPPVATRVAPEHPFAAPSDTPHPHSSGSQVQESCRIATKLSFTSPATKDSMPSTVSPLTARSSVTRQSDTTLGAGLSGSGLLGARQPGVEQLGTGAGLLGLGAGQSGAKWQGLSEGSSGTPIDKVVSPQVKVGDGRSFFEAWASADHLNPPKLANISSSSKPKPDFFSQVQDSINISNLNPPKDTSTTGTTHLKADFSQVRDFVHIDNLDLPKSTNTTGTTKPKPDFFPQSPRERMSLRNLSRTSEMSCSSPDLRSALRSLPDVCVKSTEDDLGSLQRSIRLRKEKEAAIRVEQRLKQKQATTVEENAHKDKPAHFATYTFNFQPPSLDAVKRQMQQQSSHRSLSPSSTSQRASTDLKDSLRYMHTPVTSLPPSSTLMSADTTPSTTLPHTTSIKLLAMTYDDFIALQAQSLASSVDLPRPSTAPSPPIMPLSTFQPTSSHLVPTELPSFTNSRPTTSPIHSILPNTAQQTVGALEVAAINSVPKSTPIAPTPTLIIEPTLVIPAPVTLPSVAPTPTPILPTPSLPSTSHSTPALPTPALPTPALPTPALPTPALSTLTLPTPALPTPAPPSPMAPLPTRTVSPRVHPSASLPPELAKKAPHTVSTIERDVVRNTLRMWICKRAYRKLQRSAVLIQTAIRSCLCRFALSSRLLLLAPTVIVSPSLNARGASSTNQSPISIQASHKSSLSPRNSSSENLGQPITITRSTSLSPREPSETSPTQPTSVGAYSSRDDSPQDSSESFPIDRPTQTNPHISRESSPRNFSEISSQLTPINAQVSRGSSSSLTSSSSNQPGSQISRESSPRDFSEMSSQHAQIGAQISRESSSSLLLLRQKMNQQRATQPSNPPNALSVSPPATPIAAVSLTQPSDASKTESDQEFSNIQVALMRIPVDSSQMSLLSTALRGWIIRKLFASVFCKNIIQQIKDVESVLKELCQPTQPIAEPDKILILQLQNELLSKKLELHALFFDSSLPMRKTILSGRDKSKPLPSVDVTSSHTLAVSTISTISSRRMKPRIVLRPSKKLEPSPSSHIPNSLGKKDEKAEQSKPTSSLKGTKRLSTKAPVAGTALTTARTLMTTQPPTRGTSNLTKLQQKTKKRGTKVPQKEITQVKSMVAATTTRTPVQPFTKPVTKKKSSTTSPKPISDLPPMNITSNTDTTHANTVLTGVKSKKKLTPKKLDFTHGPEDLPLSAHVAHSLPPPAKSHTAKSTSSTVKPTSPSIKSTISSSTTSSAASSSATSSSPVIPSTTSSSTLPSRIPVFRRSSQPPKVAAPLDELATESYPFHPPSSNQTTASPDRPKKPSSSSSARPKTTKDPGAKSVPSVPTENLLQTTREQSPLPTRSTLPPTLPPSLPSTIPPTLAPAPLPPLTQMGVDELFQLTMANDTRHFDASSAPPSRVPKLSENSEFFAEYSSSQYEVYEKQLESLPPPRPNTLSFVPRFA